MHQNLNKNQLAGVAQRIKTAGGHSVKQFAAMSITWSTRRDTQATCRHVNGVPLGISSAALLFRTSSR